MYFQIFDNYRKIPSPILPFWPNNERRAINFRTFLSFLTWCKIFDTRNSFFCGRNEWKRRSKILTFQNTKKFWNRFINEDFRLDNVSDFHDEKSYCFTKDKEGRLAQNPLLCYPFAEMGPISLLSFAKTVTFFIMKVWYIIQPKIVNNEPISKLFGVLKS